MKIIKSQNKKDSHYLTTSFNFILPKNWGNRTIGEAATCKLDRKKMSRIPYSVGNTGQYVIYAYHQINMFVVMFYNDIKF